MNLLRADLSEYLRSNDQVQPQLTEQATDRDQTLHDRQVSRVSPITVFGRTSSRESHPD
jgi:hypothetical protein